MNWRRWFAVPLLALLALTACDSDKPVFNDLGTPQTCHQEVESYYIQMLPMYNGKTTTYIPITQYIYRRVCVDKVTPWP